MRRGVFLSALLATLALAGVLLVASRAGAEAQAAQQAADQLVLRKVHLAFADVSEGVSPVTAIIVEQIADVLSIYDHLPARKDIAKSLRGYDRFAKEYYQTPDLRIAFLSAGGQEINLSGLNPSLEILPIGLNYSYPDNGKRELNGKVTVQNFSQIRGIVMNITVLDGWFSPIPPVGCGAWAPSHTCNAGTTYCLKLVLIVKDKNGTEYDSTCTLFDVDKDNDLQIFLANETSTDKWLRVDLGELPELFEVRLKDTAIDLQTSYVFNSSDYYLNLVGQLRVTDVPSNNSKQARLFSTSQGNASNPALIRQLLGLT